MSKNYSHCVYIYLNNFSAIGTLTIQETKKNILWVQYNLPK